MEKFKKVLAVLFISLFIFTSVEINAGLGNRVYAASKTKKKTSTLSNKKTKAKKKTSKTKRSTKKSKKTATKKKAVKKAATKKKVAKKTASKKKVSKKKTKKTSSRSSKILTPTRGGRVTYSPEKAQKVIAYSKKFMGIRYRFGGTSTSGFDCSGFTMFVFKELGVRLPHSATAQAKMGTAISRSELKPGDLVFFQTYKKGISHVGIYVGNNNFIEASSKKGISITSLSSSYYTSRYLGAVRILK